MIYRVHHPDQFDQYQAGKFIGYVCLCQMRLGGADLELRLSKAKFMAPSTRYGTHHTAMVGDGVSIRFATVRPNRTVFILTPLNKKLVVAKQTPLWHQVSTSNINSDFDVITWRVDRLNTPR